MKITAENTTTILELLKKAFPESSATRLKKIIQLGSISYKNAVVKHPEFVVQKGDSIEYTKYEARKSFREKAPIPVLYEDQDLLAVFKTMNVAMEGKSVSGRQSLLNAANSYVSRLRKRPVGLLPINYFKSNESGICLLAKNAEAQKEFKAIADTFEKTYVAIVEGVVEKEKGSFEYWMIRLKNRAVKVVEEDVPDAVKTTSSYKVLKRFENYTYIEIKTMSSFDDTIRIHLGAAGHPIVGDRKYGADPEIFAPLKLYNFRINITHPFTGQKIKIETVIPKSFLEGLE